MSLQSIMLLQRNVPKATKYYSLLGFRVQLLTEGWAELDAGTTKLVLKKAGCGTHASASSNIPSEVNLFLIAAEQIKL